MAIIPKGDDEARCTGAFRTGLLEARLDVRAGRVVTYEEARRRLGLS